MTGKMDSFRYEFTPRELQYFLFGKKICPRCGGKMTQKKDFEYVSGRELNRKSDAFFFPGDQVKRYFYSYTCPKCRITFKLSELSER